MAVDTSFSTTPRFRQRKISLKQNIRILWEKDLPEAVEDVRGDLLGIVETGVDKNEEDERHLQAVLSAATLAGKTTDAFIPTPEATKKWSDYNKYYQPGWIGTESYIRSSATVEDAQGVYYCMNEDDSRFLKTVINKGFGESSKVQCSEDEFESVCTLIEQVVSEKQPFLSTDPNQLLPYKEIEPHILMILEEKRKNSQRPLDPDRLMLEAASVDYAPKLIPSPYRDLTTSIKLFGSSIYSHWKTQKIAAGGKSLKPDVLFETGLSSDDQNPYVCFRHREVRHTRKTRRTDEQNSVRLRKLHSEMQEAQSIFEMILHRERTRLQQIQYDFEVFELRCRVKALKRKLHIEKEADDVDLLVSVSKRVRQEEAAKLRREESEKQRRAQLAAEKQARDREKREAQKESAAREAKAGPSVATDFKKQSSTTVAGARIPDLDHVTIEQQLAERQLEIEEVVAQKMQQREESDRDWFDASDSSMVPFVDLFRPLTPPHEELHIPPATNFSKVEPHLTDEDYASIEMTSRRVLELQQKSVDRIALPLDLWTEDFDSTESPEIVHIDDNRKNGNYRANKHFGDVDFQRNPNHFSIPRNFPSVCLRKREFNGLIYLDRVLPKGSNPLSRFGLNLASNPQTDADERLADRFKYDFDLSHPDTNFLDDPARLNGIDPMTQNLRFSSMLSAKACDLLSDAQAQRRKVVINMMKRQQLQQQQRAAAELQAHRTAEAQATANVRVQQAQKAAQRQMQRKKHGDGKAGTGEPADTSSMEYTKQAANNGNATGHPKVRDKPYDNPDESSNDKSQEKPVNNYEPKPPSKLQDKFSPRKAGVTKGLPSQAQQQQQQQQQQHNSNSTNGERIPPHIPKVEASV